jgi:hypothetical protein
MSAYADAPALRPGDIVYFKRDEDTACIAVAGIYLTGAVGTSPHTAARLQGIRESFGALLIFVDDGNILASDFLEQAEAVATWYPFWTGSLEPEFEGQPPLELLCRLDLFAARTVRSATWSNNANHTSVRK